jgi:hypothetical protein
MFKSVQSIVVKIDSIYGSYSPKRFSEQKESRLIKPHKLLQQNMKIKKFALLLASLSVITTIMATGCASTRVDNSTPSTETQVSLNQGNYRVIKAGATGSSYGFRFLLGIIPITAPSTAAARTDLYNNVGESVNGKSIALVNVVEDRSTTWLLLFSIPKVVITGDVVEFTEEGKGQTSQPVTTR